MKNIKLAFLILFFTIVPFILKASISIIISSPVVNSRVDDNLSIIVSINSTFLLDKVKATVGDKEVLLILDPEFGLYKGSLSLTGMPQGILQMTVVAKDIMGETQSKIAKFTFDSRPKIIIESPTEYSAFQSKIHIKAFVSDVGSPECRGTVTTKYSSFSFINKIDTLLDVFPVNVTEASFEITVTAQDKVGQQNSSRINQIFYDKSPLLEEYFKSEGQIVDFRDNRVLVMYQDTNKILALKIVNVLNKTTEYIKLDQRASEFTKLVLGKLCEAGAVLVINYATSASSSNYSTNVWKDNVLNDLSLSLDLERSSVAFSLSGDNLVWTGFKAHRMELYLTNLGDLNTIVVADNAINIPSYNVNNGFIVYSASSNIFKYGVNSKATEQVTHDSGQITNQSPMIDNKNIAYTKQSDSKGSIYLNDGFSENNLGPTSGANAYQLSDGYIAFNKESEPHKNQVWIRSPQDSIKQLSFFSSGSSIDKLGLKGALLFKNDTKRYYVDSLTEWRAASGSFGISYYVNNEFYLSLGGTLYKYKNLGAKNFRVKIISVNPIKAGKGDTVTIKGINFSGTTEVSFGGIQASSFNVVSDTTILAVVGAGSSGAISVKNYFGPGILDGFLFIPTPIISFFVPTISGPGKTIVISGRNFENVSNVSFGGISAESFSLISPTQVKAVVASGATGDVIVTTPGGKSVLYGYTFIPRPIIAASGPTTFLKGGFVNLSTSSDQGYTYNWFRNGERIRGQGSMLKVEEGGAYTVSIVSGSSLITSDPIEVTTVFGLPANNFAVTITSESCRTSNDGSLKILAAQILTYTAVITGEGIDSTYQFTSQLEITSLHAGNYNVCITVDGEVDYKQCFNIVIDEPQDISVYSSVNEENKTVTLYLAGSSLYNVKLNGVQYTTSKSQLTLNLVRGNNSLVITADKLCQGVIEKQITLTNDIVVYPNPFESIVNINLGKNTTESPTIEIRNLNGQLLFKRTVTNQNGHVQLDLSSLKNELHYLRLTLGDSESVYKIIKK